MAAAAVALGGDNGNRLQQLKQQEKDLKRQAAALNLEAKNETRKRKRLMASAGKLSAQDLAQVLGMKAAAAAKAKAKAKAKGKAKAKAKAAAGPPPADDDEESAEEPAADEAAEPPSEAEEAEE